jgi:hypothetical protein
MNRKGMRQKVGKEVSAKGIQQRKKGLKNNDKTTKRKECQRNVLRR